MANVNLRAAANKGEAPLATVAAQVERDGGNVYVSFPQAAGVVTPDSAIALADAIYAAAGSAPKATTAPAAVYTGGSYLMENEAGIALFDSKGALIHQFQTQQRWV